MNSIKGNESIKLCERRRYLIKTHEALLVKLACEDKTTVKLAEVLFYGCVLIIEISLANPSRFPVSDALMGEIEQRKP